MNCTTLTRNLDYATAATTQETILNTRANCLFNEAVRDGWNLEMDWLWLATKVTSCHQRKYSLQQALFINPRSEIAGRLLKHMP